MSPQFDAFSKALAGLVYDYQSTGISYAEAVGALRLVAASLEAQSCGGFVNHVMVVEIEPAEDLPDDENWWKNGSK